MLNYHTALQLEQGTVWSASQRAFRFLQKSQLRLALVRFNGILLLAYIFFFFLERKRREKKRI
jgi:hypothetical protein